MEKCVKCGEEGQDRRTLWMDCFYDMSELAVPFEKVTYANEARDDRFSRASERIGGHTFYTLRVCKNCRADWMQAIKDWYNKPVNRESCGSGIYVRKLGTNVEVTPEEFARLQGGG